MAGTVDLHFSERTNLIIGLNGSGKTNLLKLISMVCRFDFSALANESVDVEWEATCDGGELTAAVRRTVDHAAAPTPGGVSGSPEVTWRWSFALTTVAGEQHTAEGRGGSRRLGKHAVDRIDPAAAHFWIDAYIELGKPAWWHRTQTTDATRRIDEALYSFSRLLSGTADDDTSVRTLGITVYSLEPQRILVYGQSLPVGVAEETVREAGTELPTTRIITLTPKELPSLALAAADLGAESVELLLRLESQNAEGTATPTLQFVGSDIYVDFGHGLVVRPDKLSFGQKRMIALRHFIGLSDDDPVIADELSNGLHYAWAESLLASIANRQSFLATQNPVALDAVTFDSAKQAKQSLVLCETTGDHKWAWRQMDATESREFFAAYSRGIQHVHEILRTRGLW